LLPVRHKTMSEVVGYVSILISVLCFGSNFVPLKGIRIGDGMFFQFCMCNAIFITALPVLIVQSFPPIHGLALFGGALWCTGNILCPLAVKFIGMGLGLILWGCTSMLFGWASGTFGLFGLAKQEINNPVLNYIGVILSILGFFIYMQIRTEDTSVDAKRFSDRKARMEYRKTVVAQSQSLLEHEERQRAGLVPDEAAEGHSNPIHSFDPRRSSLTYREDEAPRPSVTFREDLEQFHVPERPSELFSDFRDSEMERPSLNMIPEGPDDDDEAVDAFNPLAFRTERLHSGQSNLSGLSAASTRSRSIGDDWSEDRKRAVGMTCAIVAGIFFGCSFDPSQYVIDNKYDGSDNSLNYVFSQFLGVLLTSWFYTVVYSLYHYARGSKPYINAESVLPATLSGVIRGVALIAWFTANGELGFPITFPIITAGPGLVGALWGIIVYKEITGKRNLMVLGVAVTVTILSMALIAMSR
jgi:glucose uptake protein GlcU